MRKTLEINIPNFPRSRGPQVPPLHANELPQRVGAGSFLVQSVVEAVKGSFLADLSETHGPIWKGAIVKSARNLPVLRDTVGGYVSLSARLPNGSRVITRNYVLYGEPKTDGKMKVNLCEVGEIDERI